MLKESRFPKLPYQANRLDSHFRTTKKHILFNDFVESEEIDDADEYAQERDFPYPWRNLKTHNITAPLTGTSLTSCRLMTNYQPVHTR